MRSRREAHRHHSSVAEDHQLAPRPGFALDIPGWGSAGARLLRYQQRFPENLTAFEIVEFPPDEDWVTDGPVQSTG
jgi:hypothetical protein